MMFEAPSFFGTTDEVTEIMHSSKQGLVEMKRPGRKLATAERWKEIWEACPESVICPRGNVNMPHKKIVMGWRHICCYRAKQFSLQGQKCLASTNE